MLSTEKTNRSKVTKPLSPATQVQDKQAKKAYLRLGKGTISDLEGELILEVWIDAYLQKFCGFFPSKLATKRQTK
jgi:hypothetical protein